MAEFSLGYDQAGAQSRAPPGGGVEWYSGGTQGYDPSLDYSYSAGPSSTAAAYGTFEDEPPLLEGDSRHSVVQTAIGVGPLLLARQSVDLC